MAVADTGSGGDTTAPSAMAADQGMPGTSQRATSATAAMVSATATSSRWLIASAARCSV